MKKLKNITAIEDYFGNRTKWAEALDIPLSRLCTYLYTTGIPAKRAIQLEIVTNGLFKARDTVGLLTDGSHSDWLSKQR